jgi:nucleoid-associated protein YgaU
MSDTESTAAEPQPRLAAFAVLIGGLLLVFAVISRLDRIVEKVSQAGTPPAAIEERGTHRLDPRRVLTIIGGEEDSPAGPRAPARPEPAAPAAAPESPSRRGPAPGESAEPRAPAEEEPEETIVPERPGRGTRLSEQQMARRDRVPAEATHEAPPRRPRGRTRYTTGPAPEPECPAPRRHRLTETDTLWSLAAQTYGHGRYYTAILAANPGLKADALPVGKTILLPPREAVVGAGTELARGPAAE